MMTATVVADTSVLINFLNIDRMDLLGRHPNRFLTTDHVEVEIEEVEQRVRYHAALAAGYIETCTVTDPKEVKLYMELGPGRRLGSGECSAIAVALNRHHTIAIDDNKAVNRALREGGIAASKLTIIRTSDVIVTLIRVGVLTVAEADVIKDAWARDFRYRIKVNSFTELL
jgi:predicted nucleic acid-binding protein